MELVKNILAPFGAGCIVVYLIVGIRSLVLHLKNKFEQRVIKGVVEQLRFENHGLPNARQFPEHSIPITIGKGWSFVNLETYIKSYLKIKGLIKEGDVDAYRDEQVE